MDTDPKRSYTNDENVQGDDNPHMSILPFLHGTRVLHKLVPGTADEKKGTYNF